MRHPGAVQASDFRFTGLSLGRAVVFTWASLVHRRTRIGSGSFSMARNVVSDGRFDGVKTVKRKVVSARVVILGFDVVGQLAIRC